MQLLKRQELNSNNMDLHENVHLVGLVDQMNKM